MNFTAFKTVIRERFYPILRFFFKRPMDFYGLFLQAENMIVSIHVYRTQSDTVSRIAFTFLFG
jgi:hypothetical protein